LCPRGIRKETSDRIWGNPEKNGVLKRTGRKENKIRQRRSKMTPSSPGKKKEVGENRRVNFSKKNRCMATSKNRLEMKGAERKRKKRRKKWRREAEGAGRGARLLSGGGTKGPYTASDITRGEKDPKES